jgi:predicted RND superfamily exporter protein
MIGVALLLLVLSRSVKYTLLPLFTVVIAIIWTLGIIGFLGLPFNSITSSVLSITIGIGIDFGLQLSIRYRQDREKMERKEAMVETLENTLYPMIITVIAALIGFQAMTLGNLKLMADLGTTMGVSMIASMIAAVTIVAALILVFDRKKKK